MLRGGGWNYDPEFCRSANRYYFFVPSDHYYFDFGFRVAVTAPGP